MQPHSMIAHARKTAKLPSTFEGLNERLPLYRNQDERDYEAAHGLAKELVMLDDPTDGQLRYLDTLSVLMETYEREHHTGKDRPRVGLEVLKLLVHEHNLTASELG